MTEKDLAEDYRMVLHESESMGCNKIKALYNIPLKNMEMIVQALEKQIQKKPNAYHTRFFGDDRMAYDCPNCKHCFTMMKPNYNDNIVRNKYCDICGQAIDWSDEE